MKTLEILDAASAAEQPYTAYGCAHNCTRTLVQHDLSSSCNSACTTHRSHRRRGVSSAWSRLQSIARTADLLSLRCTRGAVLVPARKAQGAVPVTSAANSGAAVTASVEGLDGALNALPSVQSIARAVAGNKLHEHPRAPGSAPPAPVAGSKRVRPEDTQGHAIDCTGQRELVRVLFGALCCDDLEVRQPRRPGRSGPSRSDATCLHPRCRTTPYMCHRQWPRCSTPSLLRGRPRS